MNPSPRSSVSRAVIAVLALLALTASALAARSNDLAVTSAQMIAQAMQQSPVRQSLRGESTMFALPAAALATQQSLSSIRLAAVNAPPADGDARRSDAGDGRVDLSFVAPTTAATQGSPSGNDRPSGLALLLAAVLAMVFMARRRGVL